MACMGDALLGYRDSFPILASSTYLINNSLGAMPGEVASRMADYARIWAERGVRAWAEEWWELPGRVGDLVAPLLGAPLGTVSMHTNVTLATAVFLGALPASRRTRVVTTELQFPSVQYLLEQWCAERGLEFVRVPAPDGIGSDPQRLLDAIDARTLVVSVSHAEFRSAFLNDAEAVARRCREVGARLLLDTFQSAGVVPIEARRWGVWRTRRPSRSSLRRCAGATTPTASSTARRRSRASTRPRRACASTARSGSPRSARSRAS
jgi:kynureninase